MICRKWITAALAALMVLPMVMALSGCFYDRHDDRDDRDHQRSHYDNDRHDRDHDGR